MSVTVKVDWDKFQKDLNRALALPGRTIAERLNSRAYMVARRAMDYTKRADKAAIMALGLTEYTRLKTHGARTKKAGQLKLNKQGKLSGVKKADYAALDYAFLNLLGYMSKVKKVNAGKWARQFANREALNQSARNWITAKIRAINFLASTWRPIIRRFDRYADQKGGLLPVPNNRHSEVRSFGRPAKESWNPVAEFGCVVGSDKSGTPLRPYAQQLLHKAIEESFAVEQRELSNHLEKRLKREFKREGAVVV